MLALQIIESPVAGTGVLHTRLQQQTFESYLKTLNWIAQLHQACHLKPLQPANPTSKPHVWLITRLTKQGLPFVMDNAPNQPFNTNNAAQVMLHA